MAAEKFCLMTLVVIEGEPFELPEGAIVLAAEPRHWSMDGKARWRVVYLVRQY